MSVLIIAEAGVNHNGCIKMAKELIFTAAKCGADAVKFQTFKADSLVTKSAQKADYQIRNTKNDESQFEMLRSLELSKNDHRELVDTCKSVNVEFMSSPFDLDSIIFLNSLGIEWLKVPSGEITNLPYLRMIGSSGRKVVLSTGMATLAEIETALDVLLSVGMKKDDVTILHTTTDYPCKMTEVNLNAMQTIAQAFKVRVGYSDHTIGTEVSIAAVALGAKIIEKHFTLDKSLSGPDHKASLEPEELRDLCIAIRNTEAALGSGIKQPSKSELMNLSVTRKSIVALTEIKKGEKFSETNLTVKRPGHGITPMRWDELIGQKSPRDYEKDELI